MTDTTVVTLELTQGTSDKFYRVFTVGDVLTCQYGRNGTYGSFTPRKAFADAAAADAAALHRPHRIVDADRWTYARRGVGPSTQGAQRAQRVPG